MHNLETNNILYNAKIGQITTSIWTLLPRCPSWHPPNI